MVRGIHGVLCAISTPVLRVDAISTPVLRVESRRRVHMRAACLLGRQEAS